MACQPSGVERLDGIVKETGLEFRILAARCRCQRCRVGRPGRAIWGARAPRVTPTPVKPKAVPRPAAPIRVLLVDPNLPERELLREYLRGRGLEVVAVDTAAAARVALATSRHDVVMTETELPDAEGAELLRQCANPESGSWGCGLLAIAASLSVPETIAVMQAGATDVLLKPLRLREVYDAVRAVAARSRTIERERLGRELLMGAVRCEGAAEASALRAILGAEAALLSGDPGLASACARAVTLAEERCR